MDIDELLVVGGVLLHVVYDPRANGGMLLLVAVDLVGEGVEETVAWQIDCEPLAVHLHRRTHYKYKYM